MGKSIWFRRYKLSDAEKMFKLDNVNDFWMSIRLTDLDQFDYLSLSCYIDLKHIKFKKISNKQNFDKLEIMHQHVPIEYEWKIEGELLKNFKDYLCIQSPPFGDNQYCLLLLAREPDEDDDDDDDDGELYLIPQPLLMPLNAFSLKFRVTVTN